jgi:hypothetical protein
MSHKFIYACSWIESKRHKKPHTTVYYEKAEHTEWVFKTEDWFKELVRVDYIMVAEHTVEYKMAVERSQLKFWADKQEQLMKEFEKHRIMECVVCYESAKDYDGTRCKTCKNHMCHKCCCEYMNANEGKFPCEHDPNDDTGYGNDYALLPCPICRTDNLFCF